MARRLMVRAREVGAKLGLLLGVSMFAMLLVGASVACASESPVWKITSVSSPTNLTEGSTEDELVVSAINVGGAATDGSSITISDIAPPGLTVTGITGLDSYAHAPSPEAVPGGGNNSLIYDSEPLSCAPEPVVSCSTSNIVEPGDPLIMRVKVQVQPGTPESVVNHATVSGGGAEYSASVSNPAKISTEPIGFGVSPGSVFAALSTRQAGAHPNVTTAFTLNTFRAETPPAATRDVRFNLPPGLVGNTVGLPQCPVATTILNNCPPDTVVGIATVFLSNFNHGEPVVTPVFNIAPSPGEPVAFMFRVSYVPVRLDTSVRSNGDYGVTVTAPNLNQSESVVSTYVTIWGVPADHEGPGHIGGVDELHYIPSPAETALGNVEEGIYHSSLGGPGHATRVPLLSNPTQCSTPLMTSMEADSWREPGVFHSSGQVETGILTGCNLLGFSATTSMLPDTLQAGAPAGYSFDLHVPQNNDPNGLSQPYVKKVVATLPMGTVISPSSAWGLEACSDAQFALHSDAAGECPREAQVGTVQIKTPALPEAFSGEVYLAKPTCDPCTPEDAQDGTMVRLFLQVIAEGPSGIVVKLEGKASVNQQTGQITTTFDNNPQLPFSELKLALGGGSRATLANPRACGSATTNVGLTPWSTPFTTELSPFYTFDVTNCYPPQFNPSFVAGTTNIQAGEYTPFTMSFGRQDADEFLNGLQLRMPPGLLGSLTNVPLCKEPQASQGTCGQGSLIGHTQVLTGPGADPFLVTGGQVFLTESYKGAPFGLSIVVPAKAGPYTLSGTTGQGTVVVRAAINVDPHTAALTVTSDPLPTALDGIPLQLKVVNVTIDRPGFTFNPTNCDKLTVAATLTSKESAGVEAGSPFQVTNCAGLGFKPRFLVSTSGHTSRTNGASLDAKVIYPLGPKLANIARVKVDLPKQLPSRLTTLQKACPAATFNANPANCPLASVVGTAKANTPVLPVTLTGPVYFVSHGGEQFPNLIIVLQGYGVRVDLIGDTFISKAGITSSTFKQVPDVPISSFELYLPQGKYSALAANGNLCSGKLKMPTEFVAHNGAVLHQSTPIAVTGCNTKARKAKKARAVGNRHKHRSTDKNGKQASHGHASDRRTGR